VSALRAHKSIYIDRPPAEVFAFVADPANDMRWRTELTSASVVGEIAGGVGSHVEQTIAYQGRTATTRLDVTEYVPGERICFRVRGDARAHGCYDVCPEGAGTLFTISLTVELKGEAQMLERYVAQAIDVVTDRDLERLKTLLESPSGR
jgi:uncharacterized protein YndB with AHSA1/START domain